MSWFKKFLRQSRPGIVANDPEWIAPPSVEDEYDTYPDQPLRKGWAESILRAEAIPINPYLPMIEGEAQVTLRDAKQIRERLLALVVCAYRASENPDLESVQTIVQERGMRAFFTPDERAFIDDPDPSEQVRIKFSWRCEAAWVLLWAINLFDGNLGLPRETCDVRYLSEKVYNMTDFTVLALRSPADILNEADLIYRCHWAIVQAHLDGDPPPGGLNGGVVVERHHALNWITGYCDQEWDDVTTDT